MMLAVLCISVLGCSTAHNYTKQNYPWVHFDIMPKDSMGNVTGPVKWLAPSLLKVPNTFLMYGNNDSIRMISSDMPEGSLFIKTKLDGYKWKPKSVYGNNLHLLGLFQRKDLPGMLFSMYASDDWSNLLQLVYSNPGNMTAAMIFSKDSVNTLLQSNSIIDPTKEISQPEKAFIR